MQTQNTMWVSVLSLIRTSVQLPAAWLMAQGPRARDDDSGSIGRPCVLPAPTDPPPLGMRKNVPDVLRSPGDGGRAAVSYSWARAPEANLAMSRSSGSSRRRRGASAFGAAGFHRHTPLKKFSEQRKPNDDEEG